MGLFRPSILFLLLALAVACVNSLPAAAQSDLPPPRVREKDFLRNVLDDQKFFWLRPFRGRRTDWKAWALLAGGAAALLPLDSPSARALAGGPPGDGTAFGRRVGELSGVGIDFAAAGAFYLVGRWQGSERARETGLLGAQAVLDALIVTEVLKTAAGRARPTINGGRTLNRDADGEFLKARRSFPSGHALQAWALATVVAEEYRHNPWVRYSAFGLASFASAVRVVARKHFPSDVFIGSILGYFIGRHVFRAHHRVPPVVVKRGRRVPVPDVSGVQWRVGTSRQLGAVGLSLNLEF